MVWQEILNFLGWVRFPLLAFTNTYMETEEEILQRKLAESQNPWLRDPQKWIKDGLWTVKRRALACGEATLDYKDIFEIFPSLIGPGKVRCGAWWPEGWTHLVYTVLNYISAHNEYGEDGTPIVIDQIKEKFGGLRVYTHGGYAKRREGCLTRWCSVDGIEAILQFAEDLSELMCAHTGNTKDLVQMLDWVKVLNRDQIGDQQDPESYDPIAWPLNTTQPR